MLRKSLWFPWLRCSPSLVALGSRAMPRPCWNFVTCDRFISDLLKCSGQVAWHWTSPRLPSRSLDGSFTILANLASILAKENSHLFTFAFVQLKFVRWTHRDSATYSLTVSWIMFPWFLATGSGIVVWSTHCHISVFVLLACFFVLLWNCSVLGFHVMERKRATQNTNFKGAVSRQSSLFCLILPISLPQSLWNLK